MSEQGGVDGGSDMFSAANVARLADMMAPGMTKSDAAKISVDSECPGALEALSDKEDEMDTPVVSPISASQTHSIILMF